MKSSQACKRVFSQAQNLMDRAPQHQQHQPPRGFVFSKASLDAYAAAAATATQAADESIAVDENAQISFSGEPAGPTTTPNLSSSNNSVVSPALTAGPSPISSFGSRVAAATAGKLGTGRLYVTPASSFSPTSSSAFSVESTAPPSESAVTSLAANAATDSRASLSSFDAQSLHSSRVSEYSSLAGSIPTSNISSPSSFNPQPPASGFQFQARLNSFRFGQGFGGGCGGYEYATGDSSCYELIKLRNRQMHHVNDASFMTNDSNQSKSNDITVIERTILEKNPADGHHESTYYTANGGMNESAHSSAFGTPLFNPAGQNYSFFAQAPATIQPSASTKRQASHLDQDSSLYDEEDQVVVYNDEDSLSVNSSVSNFPPLVNEDEVAKEPDVDFLFDALRRRKRQRLDTSDSQNLPFTPPVKLATNTPPLIPQLQPFKFLTKITSNLAPVPPPPQVSAPALDPAGIPIPVQRRLFDADFKPAPFSLAPKPFNFDEAAMGMVNCHSSPNVQQQQSYAEFRKVQLSYNSPGSVFNSPNVLNSSGEMNRNLSLASSFASNTSQSEEAEQASAGVASEDEDQQILDDFIDEMLPLSIRNQQQQQQQQQEPLMPARSMLSKIDEAEDETSLNSSNDRSTSASHHKPLASTSAAAAAKKSKLIVQMTKTARLRLNKLKQSKAPSGAPTSVAGVAFGPPRRLQLK